MQTMLIYLLIRYYDWISFDLKTLFLFHWDYRWRSHCFLMITEKIYGHLWSHIRSDQLTRFSQWNQSPLGYQSSRPCNGTCRQLADSNLNFLSCFILRSTIDRAIIPKSCQGSWRQIQDAWSPSRHHGMIFISCSQTG